MLEVMTRRYYRVRQLDDVRGRGPGRTPRCSRAYYAHEGQRRIVLATTVHTEPGAPAGTDPIAVQGDLRRLIAQLPDDATALLDLYVIAGAAPDSDPQRSSEKIRAMLGHIPRSARPRRGGRAPPGRGRAVGVVHLPAARRSDRRPWRTARCAACTRWSPNGSGCGGCADFALTRLPSPVDVHLFRAIGRNVPDDKRLIVLSRRPRPHGPARRRRAASARSRSWSTCSTPAWTRCARPARPTANDARLDWNRVLLYVWPVVASRLDELDGVVRILAPRTEALGIEQVIVQFRHAASEDEEPSEYCCGCRGRRAPG